MRHKGQASIELISILSVSLLVLAIIMATSRTAFEDMQLSLSAKMSENSLRMLAHNANHVYSNGAGSVLKTNVHIPNTVVPEQSYLSDNLINLRLEHKYGVKDIPQPFDVPVHGNLTFEPGDYEIYAVSHNGYVFLTYNPSLATDTVVMYADTQKGEALTKTVHVRNPGYENAKISVEVDNPSAVQISPQWTSAIVEPGDSKPLDIKVYSDSKAETQARIILSSDSGEYEIILLNVKVS